MFKETFKSPYAGTKEEAERILASIREAHPASSGWKEVRGYVEQMPDGRYRAVREHIKQ